MNNKLVVTLAVCLTLTTLVAFTSCASNEADETNAMPEVASTDMLEETDSSLQSESAVSNSYIEFTVPDDWSILNKSESFVSLTPPNEDGGISGITIQFIDTGGVMNAKRYVDATLGGVTNPQLTVRDANPNDVIFNELIGIIPGSDAESHLWQHVTDTDDGNIVLVSVTGIPEQNETLELLLDSIKVLR